MATGLPGLRADGGLLGGRWVAAASLAGQAHLRGGTTPQDAYQYTVTDDGSALVLAVCDGLGSRPRTAQIGAVLLADRICAEASAITAGQLAADPRRALRGALSRASAAVAGYRAAVLPAFGDADLSCTAALCLLPLAGGGGWAAKVGDCAVLTFSGGEWGTVFGEQEGPLNMVSGSLPHPEPDRVTEYAPVGAVPSGLVVLATDGLAEDVFSSPGVRDWLAGRWSVPCGAARMADSLRYRRRGSHDDRTALVVWPPAAEAGG
ncbi:protein phosphatase 2C domain-containing protein [Actinacidiphila sp. ITFR-21]|uniref:protein phosphatase 2C domain-containing protein n=1 Tax=Actinacidiphila sp. ITFR-21 TaxID=3075199 RepID=UPI00288AA966|nr:protein phosphatase 2C domain-containing protein [Streptomyces sp. ITFR-21]WNI16103.1 protein phosphatase 2C domain-containing protein [Streptomyces sp. ITFR-21]